MKYYKIPNLTSFDEDVYFIYKVDKKANIVWQWSNNTWVRIKINATSFYNNEEISASEAFMEVI